MGKERRKKKFGHRHNPLGRDIMAQRLAGPQKRHKHGEEHQGDDFMDVTTDGFIPPKQSEKIFKYARSLQTEEDAELEAEEAAERPEGAAGGEEEEDDEEDVELEFSDTVSQKSQFTELCSMPDIEADLDPEDERILDELMPQSFVQTRNLADLIMEKIRAKEQAKMEQERLETASQADAVEKPPEIKFDPKVVRVYKAVGKLLSKYRSGKMPKALKILPHLQNWEELLLLTKPHRWTPHAMYQATRIFASNLNEMMAQRFYNAVLLPSVRAHMKATKSMPPHYYMAIRKAIFKQRAFLKGFLLPLCEAGDCGLREAMIIGSVLQKTSMKVVNAAVAMAKIALMPYSGACSLFLRVFIDKQFRLPLGCIDALVQHFGAMLQPEAPRELPVLWHQSLLVFIQRYRNELTPDQIMLLNKVCNRHNHYLITSEIRRELLPIMQRIHAAKTTTTLKK
eukprot:GGOE01014024.1.p1 GENE.GGOE01014024.1~~GGOE01014024.1.p1  ORF type:complete len:470 (-),score=204.38 GGOE01014024.1:252-1610(-)